MSNITRRATWLELFYDLVFVIAIAKISHYLLHTPTPMGLITFIALFFMVWWVWMGFSYHADLYENSHWSFPFILYLSMLGIIIFSIQIEHLASQQYAPVILSYLVLRLLLLASFAITWWHHKADRPFLNFYLIGFPLGIVFWGIALLTHSLIFCLVGFVIEFSTPLLAYLFASTRPQQVSHLDERLGLFLLIVLGETIASVTFSISNGNNDIHNMLICIISFFIAIVLWKLYFSRIREDSVHQAIRSTKLRMARSFAFGNSHVLLAITIVLFGVSLDWLALKQTAFDAKFAYSSSLAAYVFFLTLNQWLGINLTHSTLIFTRFIIGIAIIFAPVLMRSTALLAATLLLLLAGLAIWENRLNTSQST